MTLNRIKWDAVVIGLLLVLATGLGVTIKFQSTSNARLNRQNRQLAQEKTSAEVMTINVLKATALFNDIARATHNDNQASNAESERRVVVSVSIAYSDDLTGMPETLNFDVTR